MKILTMFPGMGSEFSVLVVKHWMIEDGFTRRRNGCATTRRLTVSNEKGAESLLWKVSHDDATT